MKAKTFQHICTTATTIAIAVLSELDGAMAQTPILTNPDEYKIELFADFSSLAPPLDAFQMTITSGENGFEAGMYVTSGPSMGTLGDRLVRVDSQGAVTVVKEGLRNSETLVFAKGDYGDGILITEPFDRRIRRLLPDGTLTTFATIPPTDAAFGPSTLAYGPDNFLYATDGASTEISKGSRDILKINPDGTTEVFASIPEVPDCPACIVQVQSALDYISINDAGQWQRGGGFVSGTFSVSIPGSGPLGLDALYSISLDGRATKLVDGLSAIELIELGPGSSFGWDLYVATLGSFPVDDATRGNGAVYTLAPDGTLSEFLTNINAIDVAFDTEGILGGGMFVTEGTNFNGPGRIWRITPVSTTEPSAIFGLAIALGALGTSLRGKNSE